MRIGSVPYFWQAATLGSRLALRFARFAARERTSGQAGIRYLTGARPAAVHRPALPTRA